MAENELALSVVQLENPNPEEYNLILGMSHFIKTVEDIHECLVNAVPNIKFGLAFMEASGPRLIRHTGTDEESKQLALKNMRKLQAGHTFILFLKNAYPINVLSKIKEVPEVCGIFCASANPVQVIIAETSQGRGILGVIDGTGSDKVETEEDIKCRKEFLRKIGYKL